MGRYIDRTCQFLGVQCEQVRRQDLDLRTTPKGHTQDVSGPSGSVDRTVENATVSGVTGSGVTGSGLTLRVAKS